jgi:hypothetical protein
VTTLLLTATLTATLIFHAPPPDTCERVKAVRGSWEQSLAASQATIEAKVLKRVAKGKRGNVGWVQGREMRGYKNGVVLYQARGVILECKGELDG